MSREEMLQDPVIRTLVVRVYKAGQIAEARRSIEDEVIRKRRIDEILASTLDARELDLDLMLGAKNDRGENLPDMQGTRV